MRDHEEVDGVSEEILSLTILAPKVGLGIHKCDKNKDSEEGHINDLGLGRFVNFPNF